MKIEILREKSRNHFNHHLRLFQLLQQFFLSAVFDFDFAFLTLTNNKYNMRIQMKKISI